MSVDVKIVSELPNKEMVVITNDRNRIITLLGNGYKIFDRKLNSSDYIYEYSLYFPIKEYIDKIENDERLKKLEDDISLIKKLIVDEHERNQAIRVFNLLEKEIKKDKEDKEVNKPHEIDG